MRFTIIIINCFLVVFLFACSQNYETNNILKKYIGMDISKTNSQELGSCDSMALSTTSIQDSLFFLFRIPHNACSSCYNQEISTMRDYFKDKRLPIIVTSFDKCRDFLAFGNNYGFNKKELFNSTSLIRNLDEQKVPYYLLLDSLFTIKDIFITRKNNHLSTIEFFSSHSSTVITNIKFDDQNIRLNAIKQGIPKTVTFYFTNTGNKPLIINHIESSCGCTETKWSKNPIKSNERGEISVTYDAENPGKFRKTLMLYCNTSKGVEILSIEGFVE